MPLEDIRQSRIDKLSKLRKAGIDPYPARVFRTHEIAEVLADFDGFAKSGKNLVLVGRVMAMREHGGSAFLDFVDGTGKLQALFKKNDLGEKDYKLFLETVDIGDFIEITGTAFRTKKNEPTIEAKKYRILTKTLLPLPEKFHGLQDVEERFRKRYLDLLLNPELREKFKTRTSIISELRRFLDRNGFMEVETLTLQTLAGGANARPFKTKINALDMDVYLRIAPELFLKRLLVAGFEKVYEFCKNFRNEGMDKDHNPEFSELEFYIAYKDYEWLMKFTEEMLETMVANIFGNTKIKYKDEEIDFAGPYKRISFNELLKKYADIDYDEASEEELAKKAEELKITIERAMTKGNIADEIYKKVVRSNIIQPTFMINHPLELSPLSKKIPDDPEHVARFQLIVGGTEIVNAFSELNDPLDQRERFEAQQKSAKKGNEEAHPFDEDFVEALEYGMPPAAGWGLGIDRLVAILTNSHSIREIILFPLMKPK
ncbi:MAG: lysine--tRNA ligase [Minisyncoccia bacterium]